MRRTACAALSLTLFLSGCWTGYHRAQDRRESVIPGGSAEELRAALGAPDRVVEDPAGGTTWVYCYHTPFTMYILPWTLFFTIILTYPSLLWLWALGYTHAGHLEVKLSGGRVVDRVLMMGSGCNP